MNKVFYAPIFLLTTSFVVAQDTLFYENFESGNAFTLNTTDVSSTGSSSYNEWILNAAFTGGSFTFTCASIPITVTVINTPNQPNAIVNAPTSNYLHILSIDAKNANINCASFVAANSFCPVPAENYFTHMTNPVSTVGYANVEAHFWWLCAGSTATYGELYYSINGGSSWTTAGSGNFYNQSTWLKDTISNPAFGNQPSLMFGFRFVNNISTSASDPPLSIDEFAIIGIPTSSYIQIDSISESTICSSESFEVYFSSNATFSPGNLFVLQLSDQAGTFTSPTNLDTINSIVVPNMFSLTIPSSIATGTGYKLRVISANPPIFGTPSTATISVVAPPEDSATEYVCQGVTPVDYIDTVAQSGCDIIRHVDVQNVTFNYDTVSTANGLAIVDQETGNTYQWIDCNTNFPVPGATGTLYQPSQNGSFACIITDSVGCSDTSACFTENTIGLKEAVANNIVLFPNPASGFVKITRTGGKAFASYNLYTIDGRLVRSQNKLQKIISISTDNLSPGMYIVLLRTEKDLDVRIKFMVVE